MSKKIRIPALVGGIAAALLSAALLAGGIGLLWGDTQKDAQGFVSSDKHEFRTGSAALVSDNVDLDLEGGEFLVDADDFGDVRLKVDPESSEPVFVGIARTAKVEKYLRDVGHTVVEDVDSDPFDADYRQVRGDRRAMPPANAGFWAASEVGPGEQTLDWHVEDGDWSIVVMNADGSKGVTADVSAGAKLTWLDEAGWGALGAGGLLGGGAVALLLAAFRRPTPGGTAPTGTVAPAAA